MQHPYPQLEAEYTSMLANVKFTRAAQIDAVARKLLRPEIINKHLTVSAKTGVPALWYASAFEREASSNFRLALGQGDPWNQVSTHVPRGQGPFASWEDAAIFYTHYDKVDVNSAPWSMAYACWKLEAWNGFGPRDHGRFTGYLWSGTQWYDPPTGKAGKYVADGKWNPGEVDQQLGCVPLIIAMTKLRPDLAIGAGLPTNAVYEVKAPMATPVGVGGGAPFDTKWIQHAVNMLGWTPPLTEDGSYGRMTRGAVTTFQSANGLASDGLAGPKTIAALKAALDAK